MQAVVLSVRLRVDGFRAATGGDAPCFSLPAVREVLGVAGGVHGTGLGVVTRVLEGWQPSAEEAGERADRLADQCMSRKAGTLGLAAGVMRPLVSPVEARAAVAAAASALG